MNRRMLLADAGLALSTPLAGCLDGSSNTAGNGSEDDTNGNGSENRESNLSNGNGGEFEPDVEPSTRLGGARQVSIEAEPEREYEYIEEDDTVHITYDSGRTNEMSFDEWGTRRATSAAASHIRSLLEKEELLETGIGVGTGVAELDELDDMADESEFDRAVSLGVIVRHSTVYSRDGELILEPDVEFDAVVATIPRSVEVTMLFDEREYTAVLPVFCRYGWEQED